MMDYRVDPEKTTKNNIFEEVKEVKPMAVRHDANLVESNYNNKLSDQSGSPSKDSSYRCNYDLEDISKDYANLSLRDKFFGSRRIASLLQYQQGEPPINPCRINIAKTSDQIKSMVPAGRMTDWDSSSSKIKKLSCFSRNITSYYNDSDTTQRLARISTNRKNDSSITKSLIHIQDSSVSNDSTIDSSPIKRRVNSSNFKDSVSRCINYCESDDNDNRADTNKNNRLNTISRSNDSTRICMVLHNQSPTTDVDETRNVRRQSLRYFPKKENNQTFYIATNYETPHKLKILQNNKLQYHLDSSFTPICRGDSPRRRKDNYHNMSSLDSRLLPIESKDQIIGGANRRNMAASSLEFGLIPTHQGARRTTVRPSEKKYQDQLKDSSCIPRTVELIKMKRCSPMNYKSHLLRDMSLADDLSSTRRHRKREIRIHMPGNILSY